MAIALYLTLLKGEKIMLGILLTLFPTTLGTIPVSIQII